MRGHHELVGMILSLLLFTGCSSFLSPSLNRLRKQSRLMQKLMKDPDRPEWYRQREQIIQARGDRVFDKEFDQVFDSLTIALATLGVHIENMERQSGYISARGNLLRPEQTKQLRHDGLVEWCRLNGDDPSLLEVRGKYHMDPAFGIGMHNMMTGLTISLVKQSEKQTKVKLRFANLYYPKQLEECYNVTWPAIDKQIFLDKATR